MIPFQTISVETHDKIMIVHVLERRIFLKVAESFRAEFTRAIDPLPEKLIIDLSMVNVMNSSGLGVLILVRDLLEKKQGKLLLCGLHPVMREVFARMHLDAYFTSTADMASALEIMRKG